VEVGEPDCPWSFNWATRIITTNPEDLALRAPDYCRGLILHESELPSPSASTLTASTLTASTLTASTLTASISAASASPRTRPSFPPSPPDPLPPTKPGMSLMFDFAVFSSLLSRRF
jgi:hypothetical protein